MNKICNRVYMTLPTRAPHWNVNSKFRLRNMIDPPSTPRIPLHAPICWFSESTDPKSTKFRSLIFHTHFILIFSGIFFSTRLPSKHINLEKRRLITKRVDTTKSFYEFQLFKSSFVFCTYCSPCWGHFLPVLRRKAVQIAKLLPNLVLSCHNVVPFQRFSQHFCLKSIVGDFPSTEYWKWMRRKELQMTLQ